ncbi:MAG: N-acetylmuramoyl-L-alanine amidase [Pseudochelatococcus sp.]|uniref:N-acetylmuramoyl-L-alanine amidase n=1 Tax=Pseudochelatococcus sp. TaxID=2020869 RepID=UPI003D8DF5B8
MMRKITHIVIHCSATPPERDVAAAEIDRWHRERGWAGIGYHFVIRLDGTVERGRAEAQAGAHVAGHNANSIGICYVGGVSASNVNVAQDTRTPAQKAAMERLVRELLTRYPGAEVLGHRDFPGVGKACPSFDARAWWREAGAKAPAADPAESPGTYVVRQGDTLYGIANRHGADLFRLVERNGRVRTDLTPGEVLRIPR